MSGKLPVPIVIIVTMARVAVFRQYERAVQAEGQNGAARNSDRAAARLPADGPHDRAHQTVIRHRFLPIWVRPHPVLLAIHRHLPAAVLVDPPQGGLFVWLRLPEPLSAEQLLPLAAEEGVTFAAGCRFFPDGIGGAGCMRLNFVIQPAEAIEEGVKRLGKAIRRLAAG